MSGRHSRIWVLTAQLTAETPASRDRRTTSCSSAPSWRPRPRIWAVTFSFGVQAGVGWISALPWNQAPTELRAKSVES